MKKRPNVKYNISEDTFEAVCATEQTGLIPFAPEDEYEFEAYKDIINFSPEKKNEV